jgi:hypothetical protein
MDLSTMNTQLDGASVLEKAEVARTAVKSASEADQPDIAAAAVSALSPEQRAELQKALWPQKSGDRKAVYITGFIVAGLMAVLLGLIAWGAADSGNASVASGLLVAMSAMTSGILGGLFGAYKG